MIGTQGGIFGPSKQGGGVFQTSILGLGAVNQEILSLQVSANAILPGLGVEKLKEDGVLGPKTCSAVSAIIKSGKYSNWKLPSGCSGGASTAVVSPSEPSTPSTPSVETPIVDPFAYQAPSSSGGMSKLLIAGLGAALVVGGWYLYSKKKGHK